MRSFSGALLAVAVAVAVAGAAGADPESSASELRKKAEAHWANVEAGKSATHETKHFVLLASEGMAGKLKDVGELLEKQHDKAKEALKFEPKEDDKGEVLPGKVAVYLFPERSNFTSFVRRIEARRLLPEETGSFQASDDKLHVAVGPPRGKQGWPVEMQAAQEVASLMLQRRAGTRTPLPEWLVTGFGRATYYRVAPRDKLVLADRGLAANLSRKRNPADIWDGKTDADEADALAGSLADFLAYGPGEKAFPKFVMGFTPEENQPRRTTGQAFQAADLKPDKVAAGWKKFAR